MIIARGQDDTLNQRRKHPPRGQQILKQTQRPCPDRLRHGLQISPHSRNHQMAGVRKDQDQLQPSVAVHPAHQLKRLSLPRMRAPNDPHR